MNDEQLQDKIDTLYEKVKSHTRSCECSLCYEYETWLRERHYREARRKK